MMKRIRPAAETSSVTTTRRPTLISRARFNIAVRRYGLNAQALLCAAVAIVAFRYSRSPATIRSGSNGSVRTFTSSITGGDIAGDVPQLFACAADDEDVMQIVVEGQPLPYSVSFLNATLFFHMEGPTLTIECVASLARRFAERMAGHIETVLAALVTGTAATVATIPLLTRSELDRILRTWNNTRAQYLRDATLHECFEEVARRWPDGTALLVGPRQLTYADLNQRANRLAHMLIAEGIDRESRVGICLPRDESLVVAMLAVLKAGAAYVPLDPVGPPARLALILEDAAPALILSDSTSRPFVAQYPGRIIETDTVARGRFFSSDNPRRRSEPQNAAYVLYTSGSTGRPKGAVIEHRSLTAFVAWTQRAFSARELSGVLFASSSAFDVSVFELFAPLCSGGCAILIDHILALPTDRNRGEVTLVAGTASGLAALINMAPIPPSVTTIVQAGEFLHSILADALLAQRDVRRVVNICGATEDTIYSVAHEISAPGTGHPPIGRPIDNREAYVLDECLQPVPVGLPGELCYSGVGLAREYFNDPVLTAQRFVANPFPDALYPRLYRSGDIARYREDGALEYLGRLDDQLKIRGYRVEPVEIEYVLATHPDIAAIAVVPGRGPDASPVLVACAVVRPEATLSLEALRTFAATRLPAYMLPSALLVMLQLPVNASGKVDRRALAALDIAPQKTDAVREPSTPLERELADIWCEQLGIEQVGPDDDFFLLGGHSLVAVRILSRLRKQFGVPLDLRTFVANPCVAAVARSIRDAQNPARG